MKSQIPQLKGGQKVMGLDRNIQPALFFDGFPSSGESSSQSPQEFPIDQQPVHPPHRHEGP